MDAQISQYYNIKPANIDRTSSIFSNLFKNRSNCTHPTVLLLGVLPKLGEKPKKEFNIRATFSPFSHEKLVT